MKQTISLQLIPEDLGIYCSETLFHFPATVVLQGKPWCWCCAGELLGIKSEKSVKWMEPKTTRKVSVEVHKDLDGETVKLRIEKKLAGR